VTLLGKLTLHAANEKFYFCHIFKICCKGTTKNRDTQENSRNFQFKVAILEAVAVTGGMRMGIVGREGVGDFDTEIEGCERRDEAAVLPVGIQDRGQDTLQRETVTGFGEHD